MARRLVLSLFALMLLLGVAAAGTDGGGGGYRPAPVDSFGGQ